jgi:Zn-dependent oligopeptidase
LNLRPEIRDEAERLKARITELCNVFQNNVNEDETTLLFTAEELAGMHPNFIKVIV